MKIINLVQKSPEWLEFRMNGVGGSDIASIAKIKGAFKSYNELLSFKLGLQKEVQNEFIQNLFRQGNEWEEVVRDHFNNNGYKFEQIVACRDDNERLFASLDGIDFERELVLEIKFCSTKSKFEEYKEKNPKHYVAQVQWELFVTGFKRAVLAYVHDGDIFLSHIHADEKMQNELLDEALKFLKVVDDSKAGSALAPIKMIESDDMDKLALLKKTEQEMSDQLKVVQAEIKKIAEKLLREHHALKVENNNVSVFFQERKGSVDYEKIPELQKINLDLYRKPDTKSVQTRIKKGALNDNTESKLSID